MLLPDTDADVARAPPTGSGRGWPTTHWPRRPITASLGIATTAPGVSTAAESMIDQADLCALPIETHGPQSCGAISPRSGRHSRDRAARGELPLTDRSQTPIVPAGSPPT